MTFRQFDNPNNLTMQVLLFRIKPLDTEATIRIDNFITTEGQPYQYINVESDILTDTQIEQVVSTPVTVAETNKKLSENLAEDNAISILTAGGLGGVNVNDVNNNADRDTLMRALCFKAGLCDYLGVLYGEPLTGNQPNQNNANSNKNS